MDKNTRKQIILENYDKTYDEIAMLVGCKSGESVRNFCKREGLPNKRVNSQSKRSPKDKSTNVLIAVKQRGWTEKELQSKFDCDFEKLEEIVKSETSYSLFWQQNEWNEKVAVLLKNSSHEICIEPRAYDFSIQKDGQPYLWVQIPNELKTDKIKIVPISDIHFGHKECDIKTLKQDIQYIKNNANVYTFLNGDIIENASKLSIASGVYEQTEMPNEQLSSIVELLAPIAHKILWSIAGNHEDRTYSHLGIDVGKIIADKLEVPYFNEPVYVDVLWNERRWTIFDQHGATGAITKGGKINAASKPVQWTEFTHFVLMGHVHDKMSNEVTRIVRDVVNFRLVLRKQYVVICSSYLKYFNTYGARKAYPPPSTGRLALKLYANGKHYLGE